MLRASARPPRHEIAEVVEGAEKGIIAESRRGAENSKERV
jgi:hypothetical protein